MVAGVSTITAVIAATSLVQTSGSLELFVVLIVGGIVAWRSKRGDFYKAVADEKTAENQELRIERDRLKQLTDISPILGALSKMTAALDRHAEMTEQVLAKVADMNGSLRAHSAAMQALADRLILDEAARGLLAEASREKQPPQTRQTRRTP